MDNSKFKGLFSALLTPFGKNGEIKYDSIKSLVDFNIANGIDGFYVGGSTGEGLLLTNEERKEVFKCVKEAAGSRVTLIAHVGSISTKAAQDMAKCAESLGYDAISAVAPFYYSFPLQAILGYYNDIANSAELPMIIYNFPASSGFSLTKDVANELFKNEKFIGIKHTSGDMFAINGFKNLNRDIIVYNGFDETLLAGLAMGADGAIGSTYNFMGKKFKQIINDFKAGNLEKAQKGQNEADEIITEMIKYGVFQSEKAVLTEMGVDMGECRKPFLPISDECRASMKKVAQKLMSE
ncbi:MAG: N-acetylneuraminate lyase [Clostridiales bacterium]|nr:N-acetylneuraminate lyase [Clostridiales bacterium]